MPRFGKWFQSRRKRAGYARQPDLANETGLSVGTISNIESTGEWESRERSTRILLSWALRADPKDMDRVARGELKDAPFTDGHGDKIRPPSAADLITWFAQDASEDQKLDVIVLLDPNVALDAATALLRRVRSGLNYPSGSTHPPRGENVTPPHPEAAGSGSRAKV